MHARRHRHRPRRPARAAGHGEPVRTRGRATRSRPTPTAWPGLLAAAFGLPGPVAAAVRAGLRRAYADCGWDALTGAAPPGARTAPAVPAFGQLARAALAAAEDLGYDRRMRAAVSRLRPAPGWSRCGPARPGASLRAGTRPTSGPWSGATCCCSVGRVADDDSAFFLAGALLARIAERLRVGRRDPAGRRGLARRLTGPRICVPGAALARPRAAGPVRAAARGPSRRRVREVITELPTPATSRAARPEPRPGTGPDQRRARSRRAPVLRGRRSAACGARCHAAPPVQRVRTACGRPARARRRAGLAPALGPDPAARVPGRPAAAAGARRAALRSGGRSARAAASASWPRSWTARSRPAPRRCGGPTTRLP